MVCSGALWSTVLLYCLQCCYMVCSAVLWSVVLLYGLQCCYMVCNADLWSVVRFYGLQCCYVVFSGVLWSAVFGVFLWPAGSAVIWSTVWLRGTSSSLLEQLTENNNRFEMSLILSPSQLSGVGLITLHFINRTSDTLSIESYSTFSNRKAVILNVTFFTRAWFQEKIILL